MQSFLHNVPLLQPLSESARNVLAEKMQVVEFEKGAHVVEAGDEGDSMYFGPSSRA